MELKPVFNPFEAISSEAQPTSTSSLINEQVGTCPKCKKQMGNATVDASPVFYCDTCRVTTPMPSNVC